jgi:nucleotide-binding universal stress UspA family protein
LAESVLDPVVALASRMGSRVTLLHVIERDPPAHVHGDTHVTDAASGAHYLGQVADRISDRVPDLEVHLHGRPIADVAAAVNAHANELGVDLVAMCRHGRSGLRGALVGGIAQRILKAGGTAVLLRSKPEESAPGFELRRILTPLDPEHDGTRALEMSANLAAAFSAQIHLLTAVPAASRSRRAALPVNLSPRAEAAEMEMQVEDTERSLGKEEAQLRFLGLGVSYEVSRGEAAASILSVAARLPADLVVMTTHARAGFEGWYRGSTGPRVIARAPQTLLLLRDL